MFVQLEHLIWNTKIDVPLESRVDPVAVPLFGVGWWHEVLHLHLFELTSSKDEVLWRDLVAKGLANLRDTKGRLLSHRGEHVGEVRENALRGLWT